MGGWDRFHLSQVGEHEGIVVRARTGIRVPIFADPLKPPIVWEFPNAVYHPRRQRGRASRSDFPAVEHFATGASDGPYVINIVNPPGGGDLIQFATLAGTDGDFVLV